jgi:uncharacterized protein (DUF433 family)
LHLENWRELFLNAPATTDFHAKLQSSQRMTPINCDASVSALLVDREICGFGLPLDAPQSYYHCMNYHNIITIEPGKRGGKPCIRGMRITVYDVLEYLASGMSQQDVLQEFPYLTEEDIRACLAYAADREKNLLVVTE